MDWDNLYRDQKFCLKDPAEEVIKVMSLLKMRQIKRVLDLGFGAGRHIVYLARNGFTVFGADISPRGAQLTKEWLEQERQTAGLVLGNMKALPYRDNSFQACVCRGVITHATLAEICTSIAEINRILLPGGIILCTFISRESSEYGKGEEIEPHTFVPTEGIEAGVSHHFVDKNETQLLMRAFKPVELYHMKHSGLITVSVPYVSAHWVFIGEKQS